MPVPANSRASPQRPHRAVAPTRCRTAARRSPRRASCRRCAPSPSCRSQRRCARAGRPRGSRDCSASDRTRTRCHTPRFATRYRDCSVTQAAPPSSTSPVARIAEPDRAKHSCRITIRQSSCQRRNEHDDQRPGRDQRTGHSRVARELMLEQERQRHHRERLRGIRAHRREHRQREDRDPQQVHRNAAATCASADASPAAPRRRRQPRSSSHAV